mmetsp:Transcript_6424/g.15290  ORF Transcript_6424/g.15290 Transcript_6424/m.15290 type:complete len:84 (+) Transcript_6424:108-359(+)
MPGCLSKFIDMSTDVEEEQDLAGPALKNLLFWLSGSRASQTSRLAQVATDQIVCWTREANRVEDNFSDGECASVSGIQATCTS